MAVLHEEWLVETEFGALLLLDLFRDGSSRLFIEMIDGVVLRELHEAEGQERDAEEDRDELEEALNDITMQPEDLLPSSFLVNN